MRAKYRLAPAYQGKKMPFNLGGVHVVFDGATPLSLPSEAIRDAEKWVQGGVLVRVEDKPKKAALSGVAAAAARLSGKPVEEVKDEGQEESQAPRRGRGRKKASE